MSETQDPDDARHGLDTAAKRPDRLVLCCADTVAQQVAIAATQLTQQGFAVEVLTGAAGRAALRQPAGTPGKTTTYVACVDRSVGSQTLDALARALASRPHPGVEMLLAPFDPSAPVSLVHALRGAQAWVVPAAEVRVLRNAQTRAYEGIGSSLVNRESNASRLLIRRRTRQQTNRYRTLGTAAQSHKAGRQGFRQVHGPYTQHPQTDQSVGGQPEAVQLASPTLPTAPASMSASFHGIDHDTTHTHGSAQTSTRLNDDPGATSPSMATLAQEAPDRRVGLWIGLLAAALAVALITAMGALGLGTPTHPEPSAKPSRPTQRH